ncbi:MAG: hypothetical protein DIU68_003510 [Chloroflexota bacterium]|nr:MAG: hypothetical protein DIU68_02475 [Chloroflexota bacterium]
MLRFAVPVVCGVVSLFSATVLLIRAQPLRENAAHAILQTDAGCEEPCWQGILPGETTLENALAMLRAHPWTDEPGFFARIDAVGWTWTGVEPHYIDPRRRSILTVRSDGVVDGVILNTRVPLGDFILWLGQPDVLWVFPNQDYIAVYQSQRLELRVHLRCPAFAADFWHAPVEVRWRYRLQQYDVFGAFPLDPNNEAWRERAWRCSSVR